MKKNLLKLMALILAVSLSLSFAGCSSKNAADTSAAAGTPGTSTEEPQTRESENKKLADAENPESGSATPESGTQEAGSQKNESLEAKNRETENPETKAQEAGNSDTKAQEAGNSDAKKQEAANQEAKSQKTEKTGSTKLEQWLADPAAQQLAEESSDDAYKVELLSENGNILVLRYTYTEQLDLSDKSVKQVVLEYINTALDNNSFIFTSMLESLRTEIEMDDLALRIEFVNADGSEIASKTFE